MNWDQLVYFRSVGRHENVSRAAEELGITQPALSRAVARLERDLGVELFVRTGRAIALSRYGRAFLGRVERALDEIDAARTEVVELSRLDRSSVSLGFLRTLGAAIVPELVRAFRVEYPDVHFTFSQNNGSALESMLLAGTISLALTVGPPAHEALHWDRVTTQRFVLMVPPDHAFQKRSAVALADLRDETFLSFKPGHAVRDFTDALCRQAGFEPTIGFEADESNSIRGFVNAGFGIALVPQTGTAEDAAGIRIADAAAEREVGIACLGRRQLTGAEWAFRAFVVRARPALD